MNRKYLIVTLVLIVAVTPLLLAQKSGSSDGQQSGQHGRQAGPQSAHPDGQQTGELDRNQDRKRDRIHATTEQQQEYRVCTQAQERVLHQVRDLQQAARGSGFTPAEAGRLRDRLRERYWEMEQAHMQLMEGLREDQTQALRGRLRRMEKERDRIHLELQDIDVELKDPNLDRTGIQQHTRDLEKAIERWRKQHREMGEQLGLGKES